MFNRVNAFLEAIDKKSEEMADAAAEEDLVQSLQLHQPLEHDAHQHHLHHSNTSSMNHNIGGVGGGPSSSTVPSPFRGVEGWAGDQKNVSHSSTAAGSAASTTGTSSASAFTTSAALRASAEPPSHAGRSDHSYVAHAAGLRVAPLALPTKLPSFHPSLSDTDAVARGGLRRASGQVKAGVGASGLSPADTSSMAHESTFLLSAAPASSTARGDVLSDANGSAAAADALERLQARCTALEAENTKWQQEAATHRAQGGAARDALWRAEQDARAGRAAQRDAEQALVAYKETAQRLLEEAQQEVRRAQAANISGANGANGVGGDDAVSQQQQQQQRLAEEAREVRQRLELLQAEHSALLSDVDRYQHEAAKAATEVQQLQATCRRAEDRVDALQLDVHATRESLAGEVAAHADTKAALRKLLTQQRAPQQTTEGATLSGEAAGSEDVAQLQREVREARQRHQLLLLQASNRQTALDAAEREVADLKARYNDLARQFDDAQVEVDAGFRGAGYASAAPGFGMSRDGTGGGGGQRPRGAGAVGGADHAGGGAAGLLSDKPSSAVPPLLLNAAPDALRRNPVMVQLARKYGAVGRAAVSLLAALDAVALRLGRVLLQSRWVWRVMLVGYVLLLQLWVVLMVLASLAGDD